MRAVRGVVAPSKRASLAEAASFAAPFAVAAAAGKEVRPDIAAYIRRFRSALDDLVRLHREIDPHAGGEVESPSGGVKGEVGDVGGARVLGSEETRGMRRKKKKKRKREENQPSWAGNPAEFGNFYNRDNTIDKFKLFVSYLISFAVFFWKLDARGMIQYYPFFF